MVFLNKLLDEDREENLRRINDYEENVLGKIGPKTFLQELFNRLLYSFNREKIYYLTRNNYCHQISFFTNTIDEDFRKIQEKTEALDLSLSFNYYLEEYKIEYIHNTDKEFIAINVHGANRVSLTKLIDGPFYSCNEELKFKILIYGIDSMYLVTKKDKLFPISLSTCTFCSNEIFIILFKILSDYNVIYKDILNEVGSFKDYISITLNELCKYKTKKELLENKFNLKLRNCINSYSLYQSYLMCYALKYLNERDYYLIYDYANELTKNDLWKDLLAEIFYINPRGRQYREDLAYRFISYAYMSKIQKETVVRSRDVYSIHEYLKNLYKYEKELRFNVRSIEKMRTYSRFCQSIDIAKKYKTFKIPRNNRFSTLKLPEGFIRITNKKDYINLCKRLDVTFNSLNYSYIRSDYMALYYFEIDDEVFAVEVQRVYKKHKYEYKLYRIFRKKHAAIPPELVQDVYNIINLNNKKGR